jgi:hypothetical protein
VRPSIIVAMKFTIAIALPLAVSGAVLESRQFRGKIGSSSLKLFDTRAAEPLLNKNAKRTFFRFGPLDLKPGVCFLSVQGSFGANSRRAKAGPECQWTPTGRALWAISQKERFATDARSSKGERPWSIKMGHPPM